MEHIQTGGCFLTTEDTLSLSQQRYMTVNHGIYKQEGVAIHSTEARTIRWY